MRPKNLSPKRREWLMRLAEAGPLTCDYAGTVGYGCRILKWTEWAYVDRDGNILPVSEVHALVGSEFYPDLEEAGYRLDPKFREFITEAGRQALPTPREAP